jgi:hypothetical protein
MTSAEKVVARRPRRSRRVLREERKVERQEERDVRLAKLKETLGM